MMPEHRSACITSRKLKYQLISEDLGMILVTDVENAKDFTGSSAPQII